ncbi:MAG: hypothetical protein ACXWYS_09510 [Gaiellaceae bacterium]
MDVLWVDEFEGGFGWGQRETRARTAHALVVDGGVWLIDPVDVPGLDERVRATGEPRGVLQLLDRHNRDCAELAARYGVPHIGPRDEADTPFSLLRVASIPGWRERALWWEAARVLAVGDALGTRPYFLAPGDELGVHPFLRLAPPRRLRGLEPLHVLVGHGKGLHGEEAAVALRRALDTSRRRTPAAFANAARFTVRSFRK